MTGPEQTEQNKYADLFIHMVDWKGRTRGEGRGREFGVRIKFHSNSPKVV